MFLDLKLKYFTENVVKTETDFKISTEVLQIVQNGFETDRNLPLQKKYVMYLKFFHARLTSVPPRINTTQL